MKEFDLFVIGGGSAGMKAARIAAGMGKSVAVAEERHVGGECYWAGCVPTKAMIRAAHVWRQIEQASEFGMHVTIEKADFAEAMAYKDRAMKRVKGDSPLDGGLSRLGASYFPATASFEDPFTVRIGDDVVRFKQALVATGTLPAVPPIPGLAEAGFITNREAIALTILPKRLVILGAGPIGLEFAQTFYRFGCEVTVLERLPRILIHEDEEIAALMTGYLQEEGIRILSGTELECVEPGEQYGEKKLLIRYQGADHSLTCDTILVAAGRRPAVKRLNLEAAGLTIERNILPVDPYLKTRVEHIWAAGDITGSPLFTHVASYAGNRMALNAFTDSQQPADYRFTPRCTYLDPEIASIGLTQIEAELAGFDIVVSNYLLTNLDRAILHNDTRGVVKLIMDARDGQILGAHIAGPYASSLLPEVEICMKYGLPVQAIAGIMHAFPSFPEAVEAAALRSPFV